MYADIHDRMQIWGFDAIEIIGAEAIDRNQDHGGPQIINALGRECGHHHEENKKESQKPGLIISHNRNRSDSCIKHHSTTLDDYEMSPRAALRNCPTSS